MAVDAEGTPTLEPAEAVLLAAFRTRCRVDVGRYLFRESDVTAPFVALVSAEVVVVMVKDEENVIVGHGPGRFLAERNMVSGFRVFVSA